MEQTREAITPHLAARLCWQVARRDDSRVARRLDRTQVVDGVYPRDAGAWLDEFLDFLRALGVVAWMADVRGQGIAREMGPMVQYVLLYELKTRWGMERMQALPAWLGSADASRRLVGFHAHQVRHGVCQRGPWPPPATGSPWGAGCTPSATGRARALGVHGGRPRGWALPG
jgi:hypothetical protein